MTNADAYLLANADKLRESMTKVLHWLDANEYPCRVISSCTRPILMAFIEQQHATCWVQIRFDSDYKSIGFSISNGVKVPLGQILKAQEFVGAINRNESTPLALDPELRIIWAEGALPVNKTYFDDDDIACVFHTICKAVDDCTPPFLSLMYGNKSMEDAITDFETAQKISISEWTTTIDGLYEEYPNGQNLH